MGRGDPPPLGPSKFATGYGSARTAIFVYWSAPKHKLSRGHCDLIEILLSVKFLLIPFSSSGVHLYQSIRSQGGHLVFLIGSNANNTNLVENVKTFLPVKFRWIPFSGFRKSRQCLSRSGAGRPSCFPDYDRPVKHKLGRERWDLNCFLSSFYETPNWHKLN